MISKPSCPIISNILALAIRERSNPFFSPVMTLFAFGLRVSNWKELFARSLKGFCQCGRP